MSYDVETASATTTTPEGFFAAAMGPAHARALTSQVRQLTALVGELTIALVVQGSYLNALKNRRARPLASDVDEAIERVADNVPEAVADELWAGRDALVARLRDDPTPA